jgi:hypothetical protein
MGNTDVVAEDTNVGMELGCHVAAEAPRLVLGVDDVDTGTVVDRLACQVAAETPELVLGADVVEVVGVVLQAYLKRWKERWGCWR